VHGALASERLAALREQHAGLQQKFDEQQHVLLQLLSCAQPLGEQEYADDEHDAEMQSGDGDASADGERAAGMVGAQPGTDTRQLLAELQRAAAAELAGCSAAQGTRSKRPRTEAPRAELAQLLRQTLCPPQPQAEQHIVRAPPRPAMSRQAQQYAHKQAKTLHRRDTALARLQGVAKKCTQLQEKASDKQATIDVCTPRTSDVIPVADIATRNMLFSCGLAMQALAMLVSGTHSCS
jgi:hypothetical protein